MNCRDAAALRSQIQTFLGPAGCPVYVATNEPGGSPQLRQLHEWGYLLQGEVLAGLSAEVSRPFLRARGLENFLLEAALMLRAPLFLAWGVSEVDDVLERERCTRNLSWCAAFSPEAVTYPTWCWWRRALGLAPLASHPKALQLEAFQRERRGNADRAKQQQQLINGRHGGK